VEHNLHKYFEREEFIEELKLQLYKDIEGAEDVLHEKTLDSFESVYELLLPLIEELIRDSTKWMRTINRVDLNEKQLKNLATMEGTYMEKITKAILMRVFQKVALRWSNK